MAQELTAQNTTTIKGIQGERKHFKCKNSQGHMYIVQDLNRYGHTTIDMHCLKSRMQMM